MKYYILLPGDTESDADYDTNLLGDAGMKTFYCGSGWKALEKIVESGDDSLCQSVIIKTERNKTLSIEEFLTEIDPLIVMSQV